MKAATAEDEIDAERETGVPAPALVLMRTRKAPCAAGSPPGADEASLSELWRIHGTVRTQLAFKLTLGGNYCHGREPGSAPGGTSAWSAVMPGGPDRRAQWARPS